MERRSSLGSHPSLTKTCQPELAPPSTQSGESQSKTPAAIVGRDRLFWRSDGQRLWLFHRTSHCPLIGVEPDSKYPKMFRVRYRDGALSDMVNLTRAKDAAIAIALRSLNSGAQESPLAAAYVRKKPSKVVKAPSAANPLHEAPRGSIAEGHS